MGVIIKGPTEVENLEKKEEKSNKPKPEKEKKKGSKKKEKIEEELGNVIFGSGGVVIWGKIGDFLSRNTYLESISILSKDIRKAVLLSLKSLTLVQVENDEVVAYKDFVVNNLTGVTSITAKNYKYKKLFNFFAFKLPKLEKISGRINTFQVVKIYPHRKNIKHLEVNFRGLFYELKSNYMKKLSFFDLDEGSGIMKILEGCPNLEELEFYTGWTKKHPIIFHKKLKILRSRTMKNHSSNLDISSKITMNLDTHFPSIEGIFDLTGSSIIKSTSLTSLSCRFYKSLTETMENCKNLRNLVAHSSTILSKRLEMGNLRHIELVRAKTDIQALINISPYLETLKIKNSRNIQITEKLNLSKTCLKNFHIELPHETNELVITQIVTKAKHLKNLVLKYLTKKKMTYDEVEKSITKKNIIIRSKSLVKFKIVEPFSKDYPVHYIIKAKSTFKECQNLKTIVIIPNKSRKYFIDKMTIKNGDLREDYLVEDGKLFDGFKNLLMDTGGVIIENPPRGKQEKKNENKTKKSDKKQKSAKELELEKKEREMEDIILKQAGVIALKPQDEMTMMDEEILTQAEEIMLERKKREEKLRKENEENEEEGEEIIDEEEKKLLEEEKQLEMLRKIEEEKAKKKARREAKERTRSMWNEIRKKHREKMLEMKQSDAGGSLLKKRQREIERQKREMEEKAKFIEEEKRQLEKKKEEERKREEEEKKRKEEEEKKKKEMEEKERMKREMLEFRKRRKMEEKFKRQREERERIEEEKRKKKEQEKELYGFLHSDSKEIVSNLEKDKTEAGDEVFEFQNILGNLRKNQEKKKKTRELDAIRESEENDIELDIKNEVDNTLEFNNDINIDEFNENDIGTKEKDFSQENATITSLDDIGDFNVKKKDEPTIKIESKNEENNEDDPLGDISGIGEGLDDDFDLGLNMDGEMSEIDTILFE